MKMKKHSLAATAFVIGATVFATAAFADIAIGNGYVSLKDAIKETSGRIERESANLTLEAEISLRYDGVEIMNGKNTIKYDPISEMYEQTESSSNFGDSSSYYSYRDTDKTVSRGMDGQTYVYKRGGFSAYEDVFIKDPVPDLEKIMDAFVGGLADIVQMEEDGGRITYTASLTETQVPALVNAVGSFAIKQGVMRSTYYEENGYNTLTDNIYLKDASLKAIKGENGYMESIIAQGAVLGNDINGTEHRLELELFAALKDIGGTMISAPDLTDAIVQEHTKFADVPGITTGTFQSNIVVREGEGFERAGVRTVIIHSVNASEIQGTYSEVYFDGSLEDYSYEFTAKPEEENAYRVQFEYTDDNGVARSGFIDVSGPLGENIFFSQEIERTVGKAVHSNDEFLRVFE